LRLLNKQKEGKKKGEKEGMKEERKEGKNKKKERKKERKKENYSVLSLKYKIRVDDVFKNCTTCNFA
jgi:hypothetical protein